MTHYESKSVGRWIYAIAGLLVAAGILVATLLETDELNAVAVGVAIGLLGLFVATFGTLTVRVDRDAVAWRFGPGPIGWSVPLRRIRGVEARRSPWYFGWGIRWTPRGWLWRANGLEAVWLEFDNGRSVGVGTEDTEGLERAVRERLGSAG